MYGYPVEVETDCQALRDVLMNDKLSATHARWRDGVLAHNIVDSVAGASAKKLAKAKSRAGQ